MATTDGSSPKGVPTLTSVNRVAAIPVVSDSLSQIHAVVNSTNITTKLYSLGEGIVKSGYSIAEPVLGYGRPVLEQADGLANKGLDFAESRFPYPFQTKTDQIVADARKPADQAYGLAKNVYDNRIAPLQGNAVVQRAVDSIYSINHGISATYSGTVQKIHDVGGDASAKIHALTSVLVEQLGELQKQGSGLPTAAKENLAKAYGDLSAVLTADKPVADKTKEVVSYIHESVQPLLDSVWKIISATREKAEEAADKGSDVVEDGKSATKKKTQQAKDTANGAIH